MLSLGFIASTTKENKEEKNKIHSGHLAEDSYESSVLSPGTGTVQKEAFSLIFLILPCNEIFVFAP